MAAGGQTVFEIVLQRRTDEGWPVLMKHTRPGELFAARWEGTLRLAPEALLACAGPRAYGEMLGRALFREALWGAFAGALAQARQGDDLLRVLLTIEDADLRGLHWERLCAPFDGAWDFLSLRQATPFSINLDSLAGRAFAPIGRRDLRALLLVAGPDDLRGEYGLPPVDIAGTVALVREALGSIPVDFLAGGVEGALGSPDLDTLCARLTAGRYTLLHIVCHGQVAEGETRLMMPGADGRPITGSTLVERLGRIQESAGAGGLPYFTFLMSCESADPRAENGFGGLGQRLVRELGLPAVLAMSESISVRTAGALASAFYPFLVQHGEADRALSQALAGLGSRPDATVPGVFSRLAGRALFSAALDRALTPAEIEHGLARLGELTRERAPVLEEKVSEKSARMRALAPARPEALAAAARQEREDLLGELNRLCAEIGEISFNALALDEPLPGYDGRCPFRGLEVFRPEDRPFFFGREALVERLVGRLAAQPFLAVLGNSGSGKSSLVLAGLAPALERDESGFKHAYLTPGSAPLERLRAALTQEPRAGLVVIDQFEELFGPGVAERERRAFIEQVLGLAGDRRVVITMRADFWGDCAPYKNLAAAVQAHQELVAPLDTAGLREAIERQAEAAGLVYETGLAGTILDQVAGEPGAMPLLQHALLLLWQRRRGRRLARAEYDAFGGVKQSIAHTAEQVYMGLSDDGERERMRAICLRLTQPDREPRPGLERRDTRRRVEMSELVPSGADPADTVALVKRLADARLVVTAPGSAEGAREVEVAHEALIQHWPRLQGWLAEDPAGRRLAEEVREAAAQWVEKPRADRLVHRGERLDEALALLTHRRYPINQDEMDYLAACLRLRDHERRVQRRLTIAAIAVAVVMAVLAAAAIWQWRQAERAAARASAEANISLARQLAAQAKELWEAKGDITRALLLGIESLKRYPEASAHQTVGEGLARLGVLVARMQHEGGIYSVGFSPDGQWVVSGSSDGSAVVWEVGTGREISRMEHGGGATSVAFSPDGLWVVSGGGDGSLRVWEAATGSEVARLQLEGGVTSVAFSPDGLWVVSGGGDGSLRVWEAATGREIARMEHEGGVTSVAFSPDGTRVVSGGVNGSARVWGSTTGAEVAHMRHNSLVTSVTFSPDGTRVVSGSADGSARVWEVGKVRASASMQHESGVSSVTFSPDGTRVVSSSYDNTARVWEAGTGREIARVWHEGGVTSVAFSPDGQWVVSGSEDGSARVWEARTGREIDRMQHVGGVTSVAFSSDGTRAVSGDGDGSVQVWEAAKGREVARLLHEGGVTSVAFSPDGTRVASGGGDGSARVWEAGTGREIACVWHEGWVFSAAFSPDGRWVVSGSVDGSAVVWEAGTGREIFRMQHEGWVESAAFSPDGQWVVSGNCDKRDADRVCILSSAVVWEAATGREITRVQHEGDVTSVAFSPDGTRVVSRGCDQIEIPGGCALGSAVVWEVATGREIGRVEPEGRVTSTAFSPDGRWVVSGSSDGSAVVWETATGREISRMRHEGGVTSVAFSPDGRWVVSAGCDISDAGRVCILGSVVVWDARTGRAIALVQHEREATSVAFSPDGHWVVSGGCDQFNESNSCTLGSARVWEAATGREIARMQHEGGVTSVAFSPDMTRVVSGSLDGSARVWLWRPEDLMAEACRRLERNMTQAEWRQYLGENIPYRSTCPDLPPGE